MFKSDGPPLRHQNATKTPRYQHLAFQIRKEAGGEDGFWLSTTRSVDRWCHIRHLLRCWYIQYIQSLLPPTTSSLWPLWWLSLLLLLLLWLLGLNKRLIEDLISKVTSWISSWRLRWSWGGSWGRSWGGSWGVSWASCIAKTAARAAPAALFITFFRARFLGLAFIFSFSSRFSLSLSNISS